MSHRFEFGEAFGRNIGWITEWEQQALRRRKIAIAGMGGVGGVHLLTLARLGAGAFHIADFDRFELANFNRQVGATVSTIDQPKVAVLRDAARDINPELTIAEFPDGIREDNIDAFLDGVDLFVDGLDFFVLDIRARVFARCAELGIPAITAAPIGFGTGYIVFLPGGMTFEEYFRLDGLPAERQYASFLLGLTPAGLHRSYLMDSTRLDLAGKRGPSSIAACQLCAGVAAAEAVKILLGRGRVRAAPWYHQFDAFRGRLVSRRLRGGNRNPLQALKLRLAWRGMAALARDSRPEPLPEDAGELEHILDLARWAPSGDNTQPWRFQITGPDTIEIHVHSAAGEDVYDYNDGQPTLVSTGILLETLRLAASRYGRRLEWRYEKADSGGHRIVATLPRRPGIAEDPLLPFVTVRSVDRGPYRMTRLTQDQKAALEAALGGDLAIEWHEGLRARWRMARINGLSTDIRLRIPEAFRVHQRILDWRSRFSEWGIPVGAIGLDAMTLRIMRWGMKSWSRMKRLNAVSGTGMARLQMDYLPGLMCAAHFTLRRVAAPGPGDETETLLRAGAAIQRFWLTATALGLVMQPALAPVIFAHYARHGIAFTGSRRICAKASRLNGILVSEFAGEADDMIYRGRLGRPVTRRIGPRSIRRPVEDLILPVAGRAPRAYLAEA